MWPIIRSTPDARPGTAPDEKTEMRIQPAHQSLFTDVFGSRLLLCTIHRCKNFTIGHRGDGKPCAVCLTGDIRMGWVRPCSRPASGKCWQRGTEDKEHAMSQKLDTSPAVIGIDIGKNSFHIIGQNQRGAIVLRQKWSRGQVEARLANLPPCLIGMEACVGAHHLSRTLKALGHDARLMPAKYVRPYSKGSS